MCGFFAMITRAGEDPLRYREAAETACVRMAARGPDAQGIWSAEGVLLGHRRLAILDLDPRSAQPLHDAAGRYSIVFNGEIYNFRELRRELEARGETFRTTSDTEVLLALFARDGEAMLPKLHGMFAFAIWDRLTRRAFVARDAYGIKPLYLARFEGGVMLASQVKALLATGLVSRAPDPRGQAGFWMLGSVPEPHTWFRDIEAVPSGHKAWIADGRVESSEAWHDLGAAWRDAHPTGLGDAEITARVREALRESVARHLVADVPVGVFLSGGIDSGALAGLMAESGARDLEGITIAYDEFAGRHEDEAPVAARIAARYGIRHTVRRVGREEFLADLPRILRAMDQPSIDGINTWYASKAVAERGLKVVVSGVGGDELFYGYGHFRKLPRLMAWRRRIDLIPGGPAALRAVGAWQARRTGNRRWLHLEDWTRTLEGAWWLRRASLAPEDVPARMGAEAGDVLAGFDPSAWVRAMTGPLPSPETCALGQIESRTYLRNQLLRDSDWASMDHSVELRTPLVDSHLLHGLSPLLADLARFPGKRLLSDAVRPPLPEDVLARRKTGFGIPIARWLTESPASDRHAVARLASECYSA